MAIAHPTARISIIGREWVDSVGRVTIGRDPRAAAGQVIAVRDDPEMSKLHACVEVVNGVAMVIDLGSTNGTFLLAANGRTPVPRDAWVAVPAGSQLEMGNQRVGVDVFGHAPAPPTPTPMTPPSGDQRWLVGAAIGVVVVLAVVAVGVFVVTGRDGDQPGDQRSEQDEQDERDESESSDDVDGDDVDGDDVDGDDVDGDALGEDGVDDGALDDDPAPRIGDGRLGESARPAPEDRPAAAVQPVTRKWSWSTAGASEQIASVHGDLVYVTTAEAAGVVTTVLAREDGNERGSSVLATGAEELRSVGAAGDVVVVEVCGLDCTVFALGADGTRLWSGAVELGEAVVKNSRLYLRHEDAIHLMDPRTGDVVRSVAGDFATVDPARPAVIVEVGEFDEVTFFDFDLQPVFGPELFDAEEPLFADFDGAVVVAVADDRIEYWGDRRRVIREVSIDPDLDVEGVLAVEPDLVVVETADESIRGFDTSGEVAVELWRRLSSARFSDVVITDDGPVVLGELGPNGAEVIDARTGEVPIRISDGLDSAGLTFGRTTLGVVSYDVAADTSELSVTEWLTGREVLRQSFDGRADLVDGGGVISSAVGEVVYYD